MQKNYKNMKTYVTFYVTRHTIIPHYQRNYIDFGSWNYN